MSPGEPGDLPIRRHAVLLAYDGTDFAGWQRQPGERTVQGELERIFSALAGDIPVSVIAAGRTDSGVHAHGQVAHLDIPVGRDTERLPWAAARMAPRDIAIRALVPVESSFHARFRAVRRTYRYTLALHHDPFTTRYRYLPRHLPDVAVLDELARQFQGRHDFTGFSRDNPDTPNTICTVERAEWRAFADRLEFTIVADRFLYAMVRTIVGAQLEIEQGRRDRGEIASRLDRPTREKGFVPAPGHGLSLIAVSYDAPIFQP